MVAIEVVRPMTLDESLPAPVVPPTPSKPIADPGDQRPIWKSEDLLLDQCEALIAHRGQVYRLRCTKHGKLILYK